MQFFYSILAVVESDFSRGGPWVFMSARGRSRASCKLLWALMSPHERTWALTSLYERSWVAMSARGRSRVCISAHKFLVSAHEVKLKIDVFHLRRHTTMSILSAENRWEGIVLFFFLFLRNPKPFGRRSRLIFLLLHYSNKT